MTMIYIFSWYGGKFRVAIRISYLLPDDITLWCDPFMGSAVVTLNKPQQGIEIINDLDIGLYLFFSLLSHEKSGKILKNQLLQLRFDKSEFLEAQSAYQDNFRNMNSYRAAALYYSLVTLSFNSTKKSYRNLLSYEDHIFNLQTKLSAVQQRLQGVQVCHKNAFELIEKYKDNPKAMLFLDPPYRWELRGKGARNIYAKEMTPEDHIRLLKLIDDSKCRIMLCGYRISGGKDSYDQYLLPAGWKHYKLAELPKPDHITGDMGKEWIWVNYELPKCAGTYIDLSSSEL